MLLWTDAHLSPATAVWLREQFGVDAVHVRELGLRQAEDRVIFAAARAARTVIMTKDADFAALLAREGPPPQIVWLTCGNTSNARLQHILTRAWPQVVELLAAGEPLVEISASGE